MTDTQETLPLPSNPSFERRVLGAALCSADALIRIRQDLSDTDFLVSSHAALFAALSDEIISTGTLLPGDILAAKMTAAQPNEDWYGLVAGLLNEAAADAALPHYIAVVRSASQARQVWHLARALQAKALSAGDNDEAVASLLADADAELLRIAAAAVRSPWQSLAEVQAGAENEGESSLMPTGSPDLDRIFSGGFRTKELITVAARPGMGKSTLALDISRHLSITRGMPGLFVTLEMSGMEMLYRLLSAEAAVALTSIRSESLTEAEAGALQQVTERVNQAPLYLLDVSSPNLGWLQATIQSAARQLDIRYVVIDYLQLVENAGSRSYSREQEIAGVSRALKALAKRLDILVIAVAQLNRGPEQRADKRPAMSDLRESGQLEQDSDAVILLHRPDAYDPQSERAGEVDFIVDKNRHGSTGTVTGLFQGPYCRTVALARDQSRHEA